MLKICTTGNIGSGKTTVCKEFEQIGMPVFNSDLAAREAENDPLLFAKLLEIIDDDVMTNGVIDRNKIRSILFNNKEKLEKVSALIGPYVIERFNEFVNAQEALGHQMVMLESAIIFETGYDKNFDFIITVVADKDTRIKRVIERDKLPLDLVKAKMNNQFSDDYKVANSDYVIVNENMPNCNRTALLRAQVLTIYENILSKIR
jgi:dephospho-CoA kinase